MVSRASKPAVLDPAAPDWMKRFALALETAYVQATPTRPQLLVQYTSSDLPNAADWAYCLIYVTDKTTVAVSTGSAWVRADGSAL